MPNPTRPVSLTPIDTAWGLAVADAVVRTYPNAATRDADLAGFTSADLLGQMVTVTDTGALLVYAGPVMGWKPPWALPWGTVAAPVASVLDVTGTASFQTVLSAGPVPVTYVAGRLYRCSGVITYVATAPSQCNIVTNAGTFLGRAPQTTAGETTMAVFAAFTNGSTHADTVNIGITGAGCLAKGSLSPHRIMAEDVGPSANPTALVQDVDAGTVFVDRQSLEPEWAALWDSLDAAAELDREAVAG